MARSRSTRDDDERAEYERLHAKYGKGNARGRRRDDDEDQDDEDDDEDQDDEEEQEDPPTARTHRFFAGRGQRG